MGVRILAGHIDGSSFTGACLYCSTTMQAFGPIFEDEFEAQDFLKWLPDEPDPRVYSSSELVGLYSEWLNLKQALEKKQA
jgi:hypothetical protein